MLHTYTSKDHIRCVTTPKHIVEFGPYELAFKDVWSKIKIELLQNNVIMPLSLLKDLFIKNNGVRNRISIRKVETLHWNEFGEPIGFYNPPDVFYTKLIDKSQLVDMLDKIHNVVPEESTETEGDFSIEYNKNNSPQEVSYLDVLHCALFFTGWSGQ